MRPLSSQPILNQSTSGNHTSSPVDMRQMVQFSLQAAGSAGTLAGTVQLQVSDTPCIGLFKAYDSSDNPAIWTNLGSALTFSQSNSASNQLISKTDSCYVALRVVFSSTNSQVNTITTVADVGGSLNNTYWLFQDQAGVKYYVWYNINSAGTDPMVPGRTGIAVAGATGATASTLGGATRTAITAAAPTGIVVSGSTSSIVLTYAAGPAVPAAADSTAAPTGFGFAQSGLNTAMLTTNLQGLGL